MPQSMGSQSQTKLSDLTTTHYVILDIFITLVFISTYQDIVSQNCTILSLLYLILFSSVAQLCPILCNLMDCSMPGLPVHHRLLELIQTHVH